MSTVDCNGIRIKPPHTGEYGPPVGETVWLLRRNDDKLFGLWTSRHDAIGVRATLANHQREWLEPIAVPVGSVRIDDIVLLDGDSNE